MKIVSTQGPCDVCFRRHRAMLAFTCGHGVCNACFGCMVADQDGHTPCHMCRAPLGAEVGLLSVCAAVRRDCRHSQPVDVFVTPAVDTVHMVFRLVLDAFRVAPSYWPSASMMVSESYQRAGEGGAARVAYNTDPDVLAATWGAAFDGLRWIELCV